MTKNSKKVDIAYRLNLESSILDKILKNGIDTSKADIFGDNPMEDKVYTKRINIGKDYNIGGLNNIEVVCVSITSDTESFDAVADTSDVRINAKNRNNQWVNFFMGEIPIKMLEFIWKEIKGYKQC